MKIAGCVFIVLAAFALGFTKKSRILDGERMTELLLRLFSELRYAMAFKSGSLIEALESISEQALFSRLDFLGGALRQYKETGALRPALCDAFCAWGDYAALNEEEQRAALGLFESLGTQSGDRESEKLSLACARLEASLSVRRDDRRAKRGYYELLYTLAGAVVAIILL